MGGLMDKFDHSKVLDAVPVVQDAIKDLGFFEKLEVMGLVAMMEVITTGGDTEDTRKMFSAMQDRMVSQAGTFIEARYIIRNTPITKN